MRNVVVTGGTGFVGANLARRLLRDGHRVHLLVRPGHTAWRIDALRKDVQLHFADLGDASTVAAVLASIRPDWIFHLAAYGAYPHQIGLREMLHTNVLGTANLLEAALKAGFEAFVHAGSSSEYGFKDHAPGEREWLDPNSHYAVTKASATMLCRYTAKSRRVPILTLRLYSIFGPFEQPSRLVPALIVNGLRGAFPPFAHPGVARDYVYVEDAVEAFVLAATVPGQEHGALYNVGSGTQTSLRQVAEIARRMFHINGEPLWGIMPNRSWDTDCWVAENTLIRERLGWRPACDFERGLKETVDWYQSSPELWSVYQRAGETA